MGSGSFATIAVRGGTARARVRPSRAAALCAGHFPGDPFVPGSYLAALMAELGGRLVADGGARPRLREIERCVFRAPARPTGEMIVVARRVGRGRVDAAVHANAACAARATLVFGPGR